jgi:predicted metal-dependent enzyme (double-stranded beta helix superfamily)
VSQSLFAEKNPARRGAGIVAEAVSQPTGAFEIARRTQVVGYQSLYCAETLRILNVLWGPVMSLYPHDHRMWAVIGIYSGREDDTFYRRSESGLIVRGGKTLGLKETIPLGEAVIHLVTNPLDQITAAIHVYGGEFFAVPRSEWDPLTFEGRPAILSTPEKYLNERIRRIASTELLQDLKHL